MVYLALIRYLIKSLSARRAWIENTQRRDFQRLGLVALRKESVDRKVNLRVLDGSKSSVALRKESVDRKTQRRDFKALCLVALRKESVDRKIKRLAMSVVFALSLSARRAWIENSVQCRL